MRKLSLIMIAVVLFALPACNTNTTTTVVIVVTATPLPVTAAATTNAVTTAATNATPIPTTAPAVTSTPTPLPTQPPPTTIPPSPTTNVFPTDVKADLPIAYEDFQHGYMFWISSTKSIWVMYATSTDGRSGTWESYPDTFVESDATADFSVTPPANSDQPVFAPRRGFGKIWRDNPTVQQKLGWATTQEFSVTTPYVYQAGGYVTADNKYVPGPGKHILQTIVHEVYVLSEDKTWVRTN